MKRDNLFSILGMVLIFSSAISCKGADTPGQGGTPSDRNNTPGDPISVNNGKVRFFIDIDKDAPRLKSGVSSGDLTGSAAAVYVNGTKYQLTADENGNLYADVFENSQGSYTASLAFEGGEKWYGSSPTIDFAIPVGQFAGSESLTKIPMFADYREETGNKLIMKDVTGVLLLHIGGSEKIASVKIEKAGSVMSGQFLKTADGLVPSGNVADFVSLNCTNEGEFTSAGSDFVFVLAPGDYSGANLVICTSDRRVMRTGIDIDVKANELATADIEFKADENVLWYDGFDLCTWGGNIMGGSEAAGFAPSAEAMTTSGGASRQGTDFALSTIAYNVPGTGFIQDSWNQISGKTVGEVHKMSDSYVTSRNLSDYTYLFRTQEFQGAMGVAFGTTARGILATPAFSSISGFRNVKVVVRFCPNAGFSDQILASIVNGGMITSAVLDGKALPENSVSYIGNSGNELIPTSSIEVPSSMADPQEWHTLELTVKNATNSTYFYIAGNATTSGNHSFLVDSVEVIDLGENQTRSTLRVLYWNVQNGMWADQSNQYKNFIAWVKKYDPDVCVWCEAASIYTDYTNKKAPAEQNFLPAGWAELAKQYGHNYSALGGHRDNYPQEITSKYPVTTLLKITDTDQEGKPVSHGAAVQQIDVNGKKVNIVTLHTWPQAYGYGVKKADQEASKANNEGDTYREYEMKYIVDHTVNAPEFASQTDWLMMGDFNSRSMIDEWYYRIADKTPTMYLCQNVIRDNTSLVDIIGNCYPGCLVSSTGGNSRIDYMYASPSMYAKVRNALTVIDSFTVVKNDTQYGTGFCFPSDHRPIIVDFEL